MPPNIVGLVISALAVSGVVTIIAIAAVRIAKTIAGRGISASELADLQQQLEDAQAAVADHSTQLAEIQERLDFAERLLAQPRYRSALGPGEGRP